MRKSGGVLPGRPGIGAPGVMDVMERVLPANHSPGPGRAAARDSGRAAPATRGSRRYLKSRPSRAATM